MPVCEKRAKSKKGQCSNCGGSWKCPSKRECKDPLQHIREGRGTGTDKRTKKPASARVSTRKMSVQEMLNAGSPEAGQKELAEAYKQQMAGLLQDPPVLAYASLLESSPKSLLESSAPFKKRAFFESLLQPLFPPDKARK